MDRIYAFSFAGKLLSCRSSAALEPNLLMARRKMHSARRRPRRVDFYMCHGRKACCLAVGRYGHSSLNRELYYHKS